MEKVNLQSWPCVRSSYLQQPVSAAPLLCLNQLDGDISGPTCAQLAVGGLVLSARGWTSGYNVGNTIIETNLKVIYFPFPPMMDVLSQLEGANIGGNVTLQCRSQAFPASKNYWVRGSGEYVWSGNKNT